MESLAIIGAGISGLGAAYYLRDRYDVHVFDKGTWAGGHAKSVDVVEGDRSHGIDTAFMVFNRGNYRALSKLFDDLGVKSKVHEGGYNFFDLDTGVQYGTPEMELDAETVHANYPQSFISIWEQADRFYRESPRHFYEGKAFKSMKDYFKEYGYSQDFIDSFVVQLCSACWSLPTDLIGDMPVSTLIGFFMNHGNSGLGGKKVNWETVEGGSSRYVERIVAALPNGVNLNHEVTAVEPVGDKVRVVINGEARLFDRVLLAMHADQSYRVLKQPTPLQREMLSKIRYNRCKVVLHTDTSILPADRSRWSSWNYARYEENGKTKTYLVYYMNKVQGLDAQGDYLVSVDCERPIDPAKVIQSFEYEHPIIDMEVYRIQDRIHDLNDEGRIYFSGTYFSIRRAGPDFAGFHESGIQSAQEVVRRLLAAADAREATAAAARSTEAV